MESTSLTIAATAESAAPAAESLVSVISLSPNTAMGQLLTATIAAGSVQPELSVRSVEAPLLLLLFVALDTGEVLHELDEVLGELGDSFCIASCSPFVLCWCALSLLSASASASAAATTVGGDGSTIITLLMGIAVVAVVVAVAVIVVAATLLVASASWAAALRADLSIGVGGKLTGDVCGSS